MKCVVPTVKEPARDNKRFTNDEQRLLIGVAFYGLPVELIAQLLNRDERTIKKKMKYLGVTSSASMTGDLVLHPRQEISMPLFSSRSKCPKKSVV